MELLTDAAIQGPTKSGGLEAEPRLATLNKRIAHRASNGKESVENAKNPR